jgi:phage major head subunit gpT-like protein
MDLTPLNLQVFFTGLHTSFEEGYAMPEPWADQVAMKVPSDTELETYGWMDRIPLMRQWVGPRTIHNAPLRSRVVTNLDWELTQAIPRNKFLDDKLGLYTPIAKDMGWQAKKLHDQQLVILMQSGTTALGFDGVPFFSANHLTNIDDAASGVQSNLVALPLTPSNYSAARARMRAWKGRDGQPFGTRPNLLIVPPSLEEAGRMILNSDFIAPALFGGAAAVGSNDNKNVLKGSADLLVIDELENQPTTWYLIDNRGMTKPFLIQERLQPNFVYLNNPTDPNVFYRKEFIFGVDSRSAYDFTLWFKALRSN